MDGPTRKVVQGITDAVILGLLVVLAWVIATSFHHLPLHDFFTQNADSMFLEEVARDLNSGGKLLHWQLPQAPYLFPDLLLARILEPFAQDVGDVATYYHLAYGVLLLVTIACISVYMRGPTTFVVIIAATVYATSFLGGFRSDYISSYFGMMGHHSGISLVILVILFLSMLFLGAGERSKILLLAIFAIMLLGSISDSLVALTIIPPVTLFYGLVLIRHREASNRVLLLLMTIIAATVLGKVLWSFTPDPSDQRYFSAVLQYFSWKSVQSSTALLVNDLADQVVNSTIVAFLGVGLIASYAAAITQLASVFDNRCPANSPYTLIAIFIIASIPVVIVFQLGLGIYSGIHSSRHWAPLVYLIVVFGLLVACRHWHRILVHTRLTVALILVILTVELFFLTKSRALSKEAIVTVAEIEDEPTKSTLSQLIACMRKHNLPSGPHYVASYWAARPIQLYSGGDFGVLPYLDTTKPRTNTANMKRLYMASPSIVITGYKTSYQGIVARFGPPDKELCAKKIPNARPRYTDGRYTHLKVLDYRGNKAFRNELRLEVANAGRIFEQSID